MTLKQLNLNQLWILLRPLLLPLALAGILAGWPLFEAVWPVGILGLFLVYPIWLRLSKARHSAAAGPLSPRVAAIIETEMRSYLAKYDLDDTSQNRELLDRWFRHRAKARESSVKLRERAIAALENSGFDQRPPTALEAEQEAESRL
ncbi:MAG: hypothetical protein ACKOPS_05185, partial [Cyanobium sp.]